MRGGIPNVLIHDLAIHPRDNALVVATHGRGFYVLDDLGPLQHLAEAKAAEGAFLVPVKSEWLITPDQSPTSGTQATRDYAGANPPVGTTVSYLLEAPATDTKLQILAGAEVVRTLEVPTTAGLHHVLWDFRTDAPYSGPPQERPQPQQGSGGFGASGGSAGAPVVPGTYTARLTAGGLVLERTFSVKKDPLLRLTDAQLAELRDFRMRQLRLNATLTMAVRQSDLLREQVTQVKAAMAKAEPPAALKESLDAIERDLGDVRSKLGAGTTGGGGAERGSRVPVRTVRQLLATAAGANRANAMPTRQEKDALALAPARLDPEVARLNALVAERMPALLRALDEAGVPWTPGRPIR
jgi:hypothetical protein